MTPAEILRRPYHWVVIQDEDGAFFATIQEFPGCVTDGATREEAIGKLASIARSWVECELERGQSIPEPDPPIWDRPWWSTGGGQGGKVP
jgi:antitoxin HicB